MSSTDESKNKQKEKITKILERNLGETWKEQYRINKENNTIYINQSDLGLTRIKIEKDDLIDGALPNMSNFVIDGEFDCSGLGLKSAKGSPKQVVNYTASNNQFTDLPGMPRIVSGLADIQQNKISEEELLRANAEKYQFNQIRSDFSDAIANGLSDLQSKIKEKSLDHALSAATGIINVTYRTSATPDKVGIEGLNNETPTDGVTQVNVMGYYSEKTKSV